MPQFDFRQLFPAPPTKLRPPKTALGLDEETIDQQKATPLFDLDRSQWTNIGFVAAACAGALISALYFFNGSELFRQAAMWPGELLYTWPPSPAHASSPKTVVPSSPGQTTAGALSREKATNKNSGDPFSSAKRLLDLNPTSPFSNPRSNINSSSGELGAPPSTSPLNQLGLPAPGGDALSKALTQGAIDSAQANVATAKSTVSGLQTARVQSQRRISRLHKVAQRTNGSGLRQTARNGNQTVRTTTAKAPHGQAIQSTTQHVVSVPSGAAGSNVGQAASLNPSISAAQQLRGITGGAGRMLGHPGGR
jgi:hypothetical protein